MVTYSQICQYEGNIKKHLRVKSLILNCEDINSNPHYSKHSDFKYVEFLCDYSVYQIASFKLLLLKMEEKTITFLKKMMKQHVLMKEGCRESVYFIKAQKQHKL